MPIAIDLTGQLALVTGATGGLGRVLVRALATAGADIAVHYRRNKTVADALVAEIIALGRKAAAFDADASDAGDVAGLSDRIAQSLGAPSIVIANAVDYVQGAPVLNIPPDG